MLPVSIEKAAEVIRKGGVVAYPTETFYGLGADASNRDAVREIFRLKGREKGKPIPVLVCNREMLEELAQWVDERGEELIRRFWPGPLTLVFPARKTVLPVITGGTHKVGVRISSHPLAYELVEKVGRPITTTSANPSGHPPPRTANEVKEYFSGQLDLILKTEKLSGKMSSTVLDLTSDPAVIIREGEVSKEELGRILPVAG